MIYYHKIKLIVLYLGLAFIMDSCNNNNQKQGKSGKIDPVAKKATEQVIAQWARTDGDYILDIKKFNTDSTLEAAYYNPQPIHIAETRWKMQEGYVYFYVLFEDEGYPGSYYSLGYFPEEDRLYGVYFQAVQQQQFEVFFERK